MCFIKGFLKRLCITVYLTFLRNTSSLLMNNLDLEKSHSSYIALMTLMDKFIESLDKGKYIMGIFLDFSKAFDTVDHEILLRKIYHYGIRGFAYDWFYSYLSDCKQYVTYNGFSSATKCVTCGVPQWSILGPLLFLIVLMISAVCVNILHLYYLLMIPTYFVVKMTLVLWKRRWVYTDINLVES